MLAGGCVKTVSTGFSGDLERQESLGIARPAQRQFQIVKTVKPDLPILTSQETNVSNALSPLLSLLTDLLASFPTTTVKQALLSTSLMETYGSALNVLKDTSSTRLNRNASNARLKLAHNALLLTFAMPASTPSLPQKTRRHVGTSLRNAWSIQRLSLTLFPDTTTRHSVTNAKLVLHGPTT